MRREMSLVREVLLRVEAMDLPPGARAICHGFDDEFKIESIPESAVDHHLRLLVDAGFIRGKSAADGVEIERFTWEGCEFLDTVRSPEMWRRSKEAAGKVGSVSIGVLAELAEGIAKSMLKDHLGFDLR